MARPKKAEADKLKHFLRIPVTAEQKRLIGQAAGAASADGLAAWARGVLLREATTLRQGPSTVVED